MLQNKKILAIIPARAGSKRVKNKNIRPLGDKPLIQWTIDTAKKSKYIDSIYVSTDSSEIQNIAKNLSVDAEPLRSTKLAGDTAKTSDVIVDIVKNLKPEYDIVLLLQPTSPFRSVVSIDEALEFYFKKEAKSVVSVSESSAPLAWTFHLDETMHMNNFVKNLKEGRSQDLQMTYHLNGAIYIVGVKEFLAAESFYFSEDTYGYSMKKVESIDIDTEEDFEFAQRISSSFL